MPHRIRSKNSEIPITGGVGYGPDAPIDQAASAGDEEPAFAQSTPDAPPIAPPGDEKAFEQFRQECLHGKKRLHGPE
jgi:hypothetical protein